MSSINRVLSRNHSNDDSLVETINKKVSGKNFDAMDEKITMEKFRDRFFADNGLFQLKARESKSDNTEEIT